MQAKILAGSITFIIIGASVAYVLIQYTDILLPQPAQSTVLEDDTVADPATTTPGNTTDGEDAAERVNSTEDNDQPMRQGTANEAVALPPRYPGLSDFPSSLGSYTYRRERSQVHPVQEGNVSSFEYKLWYESDRGTILVTAYTQEPDSRVTESERVSTRYGFIERLTNPSPERSFRWFSRNDDFTAIDVAAIVKGTDEQPSSVMSQKTLRGTSVFQWFLETYRP
jgi:hypothetical protein